MGFAGFSSWWPRTYWRAIFYSSPSLSIQISVEYQKIRTFRMYTAPHITRDVMASAPNAYKIRQDR